MGGFSLPILLIHYKRCCGGFNESQRIAHHKPSRHGWSRITIELFFGSFLVLTRKHIYQCGKASGLMRLVNTRTFCIDTTPRLHPPNWSLLYLLLQTIYSPVWNYVRDINPLQFLHRSSFFDCATMSSDSSATPPNLISHTCIWHALRGFVMHWPATLFCAPPFEILIGLFLHSELLRRIAEMTLAGLLAS